MSRSQQRQPDHFTSATIRLRVENTSGETIPPYSIVAIGQNANLTPGILSRSGDGVGAGPFVIKVRKPDSTAVGSGSYSQFLMTLDLPIPASAFGFATPSLPAFVRLASGITARAAKVGPVAGQWSLDAVDGFYHVIDILTVGGVKYGLVQGAAGSGGGGGGLIIKTPVGGIAGRSIPGNIIAEETCVVYDVDNFGELIATSDTVEVSNIGSQPVAGDKFGMAKLDTTSGRWLIDFEDCL